MNLDKIKALVERFESIKISEWDESQTRASLLDPFFRELGWNLEDFNQVAMEKRTHIDGHLKRADYAFLINGKVTFMVEAKSPSHKLTSDKDAIFQLKRYVFNTPETFLGILCDFEEFVPFLVTRKPNYNLPNDGLIKNLVMKYTDYIERADEIHGIFSREAVLSGSLEKFLPKGRKIDKVTEPVDKAFFNDLMEWRKNIAKSIAKNNHDISDDELNESVNHILNRILFMRVVEDRKIEPVEMLYAEWKKWQHEQRGPLWAYFVELFHRYDPKYNGALFAPHLCDKLIIDDRPLYDFVKNLYYPNTPYQFFGLS